MAKLPLAVVTASTGDVFDQIIHVKASRSPVSIICFCLWLMSHKITCDELDVIIPSKSPSQSHAKPEQKL